MSDRSQVKNLDTPIAQGASPLNTLRASKDLGSSHPSTDHTAALETDLSQASIAVSGVPRVSAKSDKRILRPGPANSPDLSPSPEHEKGQQQEAGAKRQANSGILINPHYGYHGNLLERFVTLIANVLKVLERILLRLLGGGDPGPAPAQKAQPIAPPSTEPSADIEKSRREEREKIQRELSHHRS